MAKKKERIEVKEKVKEEVIPVKKVEVPVAPTAPKSSVLKKAIIKDRETLLKLQSEQRLVNFDPSTGEATYKEE